MKPATAFEKVGFKKRFLYLSLSCLLCASLSCVAAVTLTCGLATAITKFDHALG
jgi:hypothetical protein